MSLKVVDVSPPVDGRVATGGRAVHLGENGRMLERIRQWFTREPAGRTELIERKHRLEGEIAMLASEARSRRRRGEDTGEVDRRLARARERHYQTRLDIDRAEPGS